MLYLRVFGRNGKGLQSLEHLSGLAPYKGRLLPTKGIGKSKHAHHSRAVHRFRGRGHRLCRPRGFRPLRHRRQGVPRDRATIHLAVPVSREVSWGCGTTFLGLVRAMSVVVCAAGLRASERPRRHESVLHQRPGRIGQAADGGQSRRASKAPRSDPSKFPSKFHGRAVRAGPEIWVAVRCALRVTGAIERSRETTSARRLQWSCRGARGSLHDLLTVGLIL